MGSAQRASEIGSELLQKTPVQEAVAKAMAERSRRTGINQDRVPLQIYESAKYPGRGGSIFDGKLESFDAFDEIWTEQPAIPHDGYLASYVTAMDLCLQGIAVVEEPSLTEQAGAFRLNKQAQGDGEDEGKSDEPDVPDEQEGVRRIPGGGV